MSALSPTLVHAACMAGLLSSAAAVAAPKFTLTEIPAGQQLLIPKAINNNGQVTGTFGAPSGGLHAVLYSGGAVQDLGILTIPGTGVGTATGLALNSSGTVVGQVVDETDNLSEGFIYSDGPMSALTSPPNGNPACSATGINDAGLVVGSCGTLGPDIGVTYANGAGKQVVNGGFTAVNAYGQIVGYSTDTTGALLYQNGTVTPIPSLAGQTINYSVATSINNAGEIVGFSRTGVGSALIWSYQGGNLQALPGMSGSCDLTTPLPCVRPHAIRKP